MIYSRRTVQIMIVCIDYHNVELHEAHACNNILSKFFGYASECSRISKLHCSYTRTLVLLFGTSADSATALIHLVCLCVCAYVILIATVNKACGAIANRLIHASTSIYV